MSFIAIHDEQMEEEDFFTLPKSPNISELTREDNNLNNESVWLEVFGHCHLNVFN